MHRRSDLMAAVAHAGVWKDDDPAGCKRRRQIPRAPALEELQRPALAQLLVLAAVELVDLLLQAVAVKADSCGAGLSAYAFSAPTPTP